MRAHKLSLHRCAHPVCVPACLPARLFPSAHPPAAELRRCSALRELHLEYNRLATPLLDLTHAAALESLQVCVQAVGQHTPGANTNSS